MTMNQIKCIAILIWITLCILGTALYLGYGRGHRTGLVLICIAAVPVVIAYLVFFAYLLGGAFGMVEVFH